MKNVNSIKQLIDRLNLSSNRELMVLISFVLSKTFYIHLSRENWIDLSETLNKSSAYFELYNKRDHKIWNPSDGYTYSFSLDK